MASNTYYNYKSDPVVKSTSFTDIKKYLNYAYMEKVGSIHAYSDQSKGTTENCWTGFAYYYDFSGTWPDNVTLTLTGRGVSFFNSPPKDPYSLISVFLVGLFKKDEEWDYSIATDLCPNLYRMESNAKTSGNDDFGNWWVLYPIYGKVTRTFSIDKSISTERVPSMTLTLQGEIGSQRNYSAVHALLEHAATSDIVFSYPKPTMTLSASNVSTASATINIKSHTNPLNYWRYKAQWKLSTASTWSSGSVFSLTASTATRTLNTLTAGATYNYRIAYIDRNDNVVSYSSTLTFTVPEDQATVYVNSGSAVKKAKVWYNNGGTIKKVKNIYYNNSGTIKNVKK